MYCAKYQYQYSQLDAPRWHHEAQHLNFSFLTLIEGSNMIFHSFTFATYPRDLANVNE